MSQDKKGEFGDYLKRLRLAKKLSLRQVEHLVGISNSYLYQIERGERNIPKLEILQRFAEAYDVPIEALMAAADLEKPLQRDQYEEQVENAFQMVLRDKDFIFGTHMVGTSLTFEAKRFVIEAYQKATGLNLLDRTKKE